VNRDGSGHLFYKEFVRARLNPAGQRPTRTVVGMSWEVDEMNRLTQPMQDKILGELKLEKVLGGASA
jgi:hypothetical protein